MSAPFNLDASLSEEPVLAKRLESVRQMHQVQHGHGNWNCNLYMHGLAVGLELALATMEGRDPVFNEGPVDYLDSRAPLEGMLTAESYPTMAPEGAAGVANVELDGSGPWRTRHE